MESLNDSFAPETHTADHAHVPDTAAFYHLLPFISGFIALLTLSQQNMEGFFRGGLLLGVALWIQVLLDTAVLDGKGTRRSYLRAFAEAQLVGCVAIFVLIEMDVKTEQWIWISIALTTLYAVVRLLALRQNPFAILCHFLLIPALAVGLNVLGYVICMLYQAYQLY